ncbi:MAG: NAD(P)-dependent oxidoreductase [Cyclobacteriaceae bacterium]
MTRIGLIREGKQPEDRRVPLTPKQAQWAEKEFGIKVVCQSSQIRGYSDKEYLEAGIEVVEDVSNCEVLLGVKEVPIEQLIDGKTYFFFSHTIKKQAYNRDLLKAILKQKIRLVDYECLRDKDGHRLIAFGRYAGIVGAYNAIWAYGQRYRLFDLRRARDCFDLEDVKSEFNKVRLPAIKIALTGGGRVAKGAMEVLVGLGIRRVTPHVFLTEYFKEPVFCQLNSRDYHKHQNGTEFNRGTFFNHPVQYDSDFLKYARVAEILIAGAFWSPKGPVLFDRQDILRNDFDIKLIADITCDIEGSIPSTKQPSSIEDPLYDYNPSEDKVDLAFTDEANITVMAIDNLPGEIPRDSSEGFGQELLDDILPCLLGSDPDEVIGRATIARDGKLTDLYNYLQNYVDGQ